MEGRCEGGREGGDEEGCLSATSRQIFQPLAPTPSRFYFPPSLPRHPTPPRHFPSHSPSRTTALSSSSPVIQDADHILQANGGELERPQVPLANLIEGLRLHVREATLALGRQSKLVERWRGGAAACPFHSLHDVSVKCGEGERDLGAQPGWKWREMLARARVEAFRFEN